MNMLFAFFILLAPFALAALLSWASHRDDSVRRSLIDEFGDPDWYRTRHDAEAVRTRFEEQPSWPSSTVLGERR